MPVRLWTAPQFRHFARRALLIWTGIVLIAIGLAGLVLPFLPGWLFILFGASLISRNLRQTIIAALERWQRYVPFAQRYLWRYRRLEAKRMDRRAHRHPPAPPPAADDIPSTNPDHTKEGT